MFEWIDEMYNNLPDNEKLPKDRKTTDTSNDTSVKLDEDTVTRVANKVIETLDSRNNKPEPDTVEPNTEPDMVEPSAV